MGVGALTDFGPMLLNLKLSFLVVPHSWVFFGADGCGFDWFNLNEAASLAIIGGADGPTAIYTTIKLAPHLLGPIAIAAYSYMALVPVIIPMVANLLMTEKNLKFICVTWINCILPNMRLSI